MTVYLNHTNKYLYILAVVYILEFGHNPFRKMVIINFGGGVPGAKASIFFGVGKRVWRAHKNGFWGVQGQTESHKPYWLVDGVKRRVKYWEAVLIERYCDSGELCEMWIKLSITMQRESFKANQVVSICCLTLEFSAKFGYNWPKGSGDRRGGGFWKISLLKVRGRFYWFLSQEAG